MVSMNGSVYADPGFSWFDSVGVTDIEFMRSDALGSKYENNIFVGDINNGYLYFFTLNEDRTGFTFNQTGMSDLVADNADELDPLIFGTGFVGITDVETGPDGYLYILTYDGKLYRIEPNENIAI